MIQMNNNMGVIKEAIMMLKKYRGSYLSYFLMYMFYYLSFALFSGLISVYLMDKGYNATQVSMVVSCSFILSMLTQPFIGNLSDKYDKRKCNAVLLGISILFSILFIFLNNIYLIAIVYSVVLAIINGTNPVIERMATLSRHKYGLIRIWGTIGYATGSQISGLIYKYISPESIYLFFGLGIILCVIGILGTQDKTEEIKDTKEKVSMFKIISQKEMIIYLIIVCIFYGITNVHTTYLPAMLQSQGLSMDMATTVIFISTMVELPVILLSGLYMDRLTNKQLLSAVFILLIVQFGTIAFINVTMIQIAVIIMTKAVCTMAFIMINMKVIATIVDQTYQNSALAIVSTFKSLISIIFQSIGGIIIDYSSYHIFYLFLFVMSLIGIIFILVNKIPNNENLKLYN